MDKEFRPPVVASSSLRTTSLCGIPLSHPIINASGTFDALAAARAFGTKLFEQFPFAAFVTKTVTNQPRAGNPPPRLWELGAGMINSIGLPNKGRERFLAEDLPALADLPVPLIVNVMGSTADEFAPLIEAFGARDEVGALELNVSCPNVKTGLDIGADPVEAAALVRRLRPLTGKPIIVKLTPNTAAPAAVAEAVGEAGADAVSLINTLRAAALHPRTREPWLGGGTGGMSGPAVRAVALAQVQAVRTRCPELEIVGMGGVQTGLHARDLLDAGATVVAVGTESFRDPLAGSRIARELSEFERGTVVVGAPS
jgi:dihydroorotate dehydrogenase (NAD+) catalytic subunit